MATGVEVLGAYVTSPAYVAVIWSIPTGKVVVTRTACPALLIGLVPMIVPLRTKLIEPVGSVVPVPPPDAGPTVAVRVTAKPDLTGVGAPVNVMADAVVPALGVIVPIADSVLCWFASVAFTGPDNVIVNVSGALVESFMAATGIVVCVVFG